ncbi:MAG: DNA polymerase III subunit delta' [Rhodospirillaceae bacterium]
MPETEIEDWPPAPRANPDLLGHAAAETALRTAFDGDRLHHGWLISGPKGIGKATLAYRFARFVLANGGAAASGGLFGDTLPETGGEGLHVDPAHPTFQRVAASGHTDLLTIERTASDRGALRTEIVVDDVRRSQNFFHMTAGEGGWRVIVVDSADKMNLNAANALLKVLEEPPPRALLLLVCHNPGRLLATIRSRCQHLRLEPLDAADLTALLGRYAPDLGAEDAAAIAQLADGSIGRALDLVESGGVGVYTDIMRLMEGLPALDVPALHDFATKCAARKGDETFATAADLIRRTVAQIVKHAGGQDDTAAPDGERALLQRVAPPASLERWLQVWEKIDDILGSADRANLDHKQVILNAFFTVAQAASR